MLFTRHDGELRAQLPGRMAWIRRARAAVPACALLAGASSDLNARRSRTSSATGCEAAAAPRFSFGVIADIQYCDCDDATNFGGTETRAYRDTLRQIKLAVNSWNAAGVLFVAQLGDLIDGQNAGGYGAGLQFDGPQSEVHDAHDPASSPTRSHDYPF